MTDVPPADDPGEDSPRSQAVRHGSVGARVPEHVRRGVFSTGVVVLQSTHEFVLDFLLRMTQPQQVAARVVLSPSVVPGFVKALEDNLANYTRKFGAPRPPQQQAASAEPADVPAEPALVGETTVAAESTSQPSAEELYDELKLPDEMLAGNYANAVMISHTPTEFCFDFLTTFFPRSAVAARVFLAAPNVPSFLNSLRHSFGQFQSRQGHPEPPTDPTGDDGTP